MQTFNSDVLRRTLSKHLAGGVLEVVMADLVAAGACQVSGSLKVTDAECEPSAEAVSWSVDASTEGFLVLRIERGDRLGDALNIELQVVKDDRPGKEQDGGVWIGLHAATDTNLMDIILDGPFASIVPYGQNRRRPSIPVDLGDRCIQLSGPTIDPDGYGQETWPFRQSVLEDLSRGQLWGRAEEKSWILEATGGIDRLTLRRIMNLVATGATSGQKPRWKLNLDPSGHALSAAMARPPVPMPDGYYRRRRTEY